MDDRGGALVDLLVAGVPVASRYPATGVEPSAVIDRHRSPPFQRFLPLGWQMVIASNPIAGRSPENCGVQPI